MFSCQILSAIDRQGHQQFEKHSEILACNKDKGSSQAAHDAIGKRYDWRGVPNSHVKGRTPLQSLSGSLNLVIQTGLVLGKAGCNTKTQRGLSARSH